VAQPVPRQQAVLRDLALVVSEQVTHDALMATLRADTAGLVREATLFDIYKPASPTADIPTGYRSLAVRLELLDDEATLTDERIDAAVQQALVRAQTIHGARLRA
jgi:phenylalanyl-tRNA synthetase beta chain